ncbi:hypothetical protein VTL71DRAFT_8018 [Oculimacula yallundae]|uniref:Oxidoreductase NAD-binding domain-containing protein 1 n=1 Tax=Oculimacula yallundae TaxID=86028 RepID=A0ABR4CWH8_9HELO
MATQAKIPLPHIERTAAQPRDNSLHPVILSHITQVNSSIRLLSLTPVQKEPIKFQPGQWVDLHIPNLPSPGGFTLTSTPSLSSSYLELAIQAPPPKGRSLTAAHWLWQPTSQIVNTELAIRTGGSFIWPPPLPIEEIKRVVFIAGGVGINPLMSMISSISERREKSPAGRLGYKIVFLYSVRNSVDGNGRSEEILFLSRLREIFKALGEDGDFKLFVTGEKEQTDGQPISGSEGLEVESRRIQGSDLEAALGEKSERKGAVVYVCGVPGMTDHFVELAGKSEGMEERRVLSEKWWRALQLRDETIMPSTCYDPCNLAFIEGQSVGPTEALCKFDSFFRQYLEDCQNCTESNNATNQSLQDYVTPPFATLISYCASQVAIPQPIQSSTQVPNATAISLEASYQSFIVSVASIYSAASALGLLNATTTVYKTVTPTFSPSTSPGVTQTPGPTAFPGAAQTPLPTEISAPKSSSKAWIAGAAAGPILLLLLAAGIWLFMRKMKLHGQQAAVVTTPGKAQLHSDSVRKPTQRTVGSELDARRDVGRRIE